MNTRAAGVYTMPYNTTSAPQKKKKLKDGRWSGRSADMGSKFQWVQSSGQAPHGKLPERPHLQEYRYGTLEASRVYM